MATETVLTNSTANGALTHPITTSLTAGKAFLIAHPVGVAVVGSALIGAGAYWAIKKFKSEKEEPAAASA